MKALLASLVLLLGGVAHADLMVSSDSTAECTITRNDAAGTLIQSYLGTATGPIDADLHIDACNSAMDDCLRDIKENQTCRYSH
ncbi:MAG: hypothetical protein ACXVLQ_12645 [Bacteriovorax sp.]